MSQIQFVKEGMQQYMVLETDGMWRDDYESNLMQYHLVPGFMPLEVRELDGDLSLYYKLIYRTRLEDALSHLPLTTERACGIICGIVEMLKSCEEYLLNAESVIYDTDYVFMDVTTGKLKFAYYPNGERQKQGLKDLLTKLMQHIDKKNENSMMLLLKFYNLVTDEGCTLEKLEEYCRLKGQVYDTYPGQESELRMSCVDISHLPEKQSDDIEHMDNTVSNKDKIIYKDTFKSSNGTREKKDTKHVKNKESLAKKRNNNNTHRNVRYIARRLIIVIMAITAVFDIILLIGLLLNLLTYEKTGYLFIGMAVLIGLTIIYMGLDEENNPEYIMEEYYSSSGVDMLSDNTHEKRENHVGGYEAATVLLISEEVDANETIVEESTPGVLYLESLVKGQYDPIHVSSKDVMIGSMEDGCDYLLKARGISRLHAKLIKREEGMYLTDLNSTNGTYINGDRIDVGKEYPLEEGDMVAFAGSRFFVAREE